jgi:Core-2/I-Branching enzyme
VPGFNSGKALYAPEGSTMKIAFLILCHRDPRHLRRLAKLLHPHDLFIHLDQKTPRCDEWKKNIAEFNFVEPAVPVYWGGASMVEATISLMDAALRDNRNIQKLVLLCGRSYPIKPIRDLVSLFEGDDEHNYITYRDMNRSPHLRAHIQRKWFLEPLIPQVHRRGRIVRAADAQARMFLARMERARVSPDHDATLFGMTPYHGSQWWALSRRCAEYVSQAYKEHKRLRFTWAPDEHVIQTIVGNSTFASSSTGLIDDASSSVYVTANLHHITPRFRKIYTIDDLDEVKHSNRFFLRKVDSASSADLLDYIDLHMI